MLEKDFKANLIKSIIELGLKEEANIKFTIKPVYEPGKKLNSKDDYMRLAVLTDKNLKDRYFDLTGAARILSHPDLY
ncbi:hypothetical protein NNC19_20580 [Clostridium sp. SHJSY1]|uniref:hypothetical protein n=1 Tax=Clostridium sp. SHJSY1 TaxID=2942483 RepID=UPI0028760B75|nr:hypothetical protein [Clostridium sp. SHJSY1]MDS0528095.1 hypothetical protein [Clostridium sp. SHJSY1]